MICLFSIKYSNTKEELVTKLKAAIANAKGAIKGNAFSGSFTGKTLFGSFKGRYTIDGVITVIVDDKPFFIGCGTIEKEIMEYLEGVDVE